METQEQIDQYLDNLIEQTEQDIEKVFAKRTKAILSSLAKIQQTLDKGGEIRRTDIYNSARYKQELKFIAESVNEEYKEMYKTIQTLLIATYIENYLRSGQLYEFEAQEPMMYSIPTAEVVRQAVLNPIAELTLSALMNNHRNETIRRINIEISQSLLAGESYVTNG